MATVKLGAYLQLAVCPISFSGCFHDRALIFTGNFYPSDSFAGACMWRPVTIQMFRNA